MPRVVCPSCRTGFEATVTRERCALNCITCGVAFNASHYINKDDSARGMSSDTPASATRTAGLPFMSETGEVRRAVAGGSSSAVAVAASATVTKKPSSEAFAARVKANIEQRASEPVSTGAPGVSGVSAATASVVLMSKTGQPRAERATEIVNISTPAASVASAEMVTSAMSLEKASDPGARKKTTRRPLLEGQFGPYDIEGEIARGGVGAVFRAHDRMSGKLVALKVLLDGDEAGETERERFRHECETAKALSLPGMVQVYEVGEHDGRPYMAMELVHGRSLDKVIPDKTLSVNDCLVLMKSVAETIGALHEAGYVHRDLKPGNILIDGFNSPKVADFGLVKSLDEITRLTAAGLVCGTPAYMAPEQARGDGNAIDPRSDVWALGAVMYEMLTGVPAFKAENALRLMLKITKDQPMSPRLVNGKVPQDIHNIVMKCLEKNPAKRYTNARALAEDIGRFLNGEPLEISTQPKMQQFFTVAAKNKRALATLGLGLAALVLVAIVARFAFGRPSAVTPMEKGFAVLNDHLLRDSDKIDQAEQLFRQSLAIDANQARAHMGLGLCLARRGIDAMSWKITDQKKVAEGLAETGRAAELDPALQAECHAQVAKFNYWVRDYAGEAAEWERSISLAPTNLKYREALGIAYWNAGAQKNDPRMYERAVREFQAILQTQRDYPKVAGYIKVLQDNFLIQSGNRVSVVTPPAAR